MIEKLIDGLPLAAKSPLAFTAYIILIVAWVIIAFRIKRNKNLLKNLEKLPDKDRLQALKIEIHGVELKEGISPEQWIKSKTHSYIFLGFIAICLVIVAIVVIFIQQSGGKIKAPYSIIDISVDDMDKDAWLERSNNEEYGNTVYDSNVGFKNILFPFVITQKSSKLLYSIAHNPNDIYLIRIAGSSLTTGFHVTDESISLEFECSNIEPNPCYENYYQSRGVILHFSPDDSQGQWNTFEEGVLTATDNYFKLIGFYRFSPSPQKMEWNKNYRVKAVNPDPKRAAITLDLLSQEIFTNLFMK